MLKKYERFLKDFDKKLRKYFQTQSEYICCKEGCSGCCENGDYPFSQLEMMYLMKAFRGLSTETQNAIRNQLNNIKKNRVSTHLFYKCPFLVDHKCALYKYRGIVCRTFGLAYIIDKKTKLVKIPECSKTGLNFSKVYNGKEISVEPIKENLDLPTIMNSNLAKSYKLDFGEIRSLIDWFPN